MKLLDSPTQVKPPQLAIITYDFYLLIVKTLFGQELETELIDIYLGQTHSFPICQKKNLRQV